MPRTTNNVVGKPLPSVKKRSEFLSLRQAPRFSCPEFILQGHLAPNDGQMAEIGYTVTKKTGNAVERNRIKRRLRTAVREAMRQAEAGMAEKAMAQAEGNGLRTDDKPHGRISGQMVIVARRSVLVEPHGSLVAKITKGIDRLVAKGKKAH